MQIKCPRCGKLTEYSEANPDRPFCSERCKTIDIAGWADESYKIPTQEQGDPEELQDLNDLLE